ncbi:MAG: SEC-C metal-binding domain-containing protein, partial [Dehalococcoidia bacterium]
GLHQAIEAKERVKVQGESLTMATITLQNYFRLYQKLAGMTGTAMTEAEEFHKIYKLEVVAIPTNEPMIRTDNSDQVYKNEEAKFRAVVGEIERLHGQGSPVLVGTSSIERNEQLGELLKRQGIPHQVLNAKQHEREAAIIARAGEPGAVTVATNMAGRGVDIVLGGNPEGQSEEEWQAKHNKVVELGGLYVLGTERHDARRIDNQLRGRSGRQGDPGSSRFYVSLEDDIMRRFGGDRVKSIMEWAGMDEDVPIENAMISKVIENAQVKVEGYHFDIRKHLVEYDDVINKHREVIYGERKKIMEGADLKANVQSMVRDELQALVAACVSDDIDGEWDADALKEELAQILPLPPSFGLDGSEGRKEMEKTLLQMAETLYEEREKELGAENMRMLERLVMLRTIDDLWVEHLTMMENMRHGIGLQAVGQRDPLIAYKTQGHGMFQGLLDNIRHDVAHTIYRVGIAREPSPQPQAAAPAQKEKVAIGGKVGRNDPCPCGSGKKYKKCHGK